MNPSQEKKCAECQHEQPDTYGHSQACSKYNSMKTYKGLSQENNKEEKCKCEAVNKDIITTEFCPIHQGNPHNNKEELDWIKRYEEKYGRLFKKLDAEFQAEQKIGLYEEMRNFIAQTLSSEQEKWKKDLIEKIKEVHTDTDCCQREVILKII